MQPAAIEGATPVYQNEDWVVTEAGLEHRETGYQIDADVLGDRRADGLWAWPIHMLEKRWVRPQSFADAFGEALHQAGIHKDGRFAASFRQGGRSAMIGLVGERVPARRDSEAEPVRLGEVLAVRFPPAALARRRA